MPRHVPEVRRLRSNERDVAATVLAEAFADDPMMGWLAGRDRDPARRLNHLFSHSLGVALDRPDHLVDTVDGAGGPRAVALWYEVDGCATSTRDVVAMMPAAVKTFGFRLPRALHMLSMIEKLHPSTPHRHLAFIGVLPAAQGRGFGSALLAAMVGDCDVRGVPTYLESSSPRNEALYARHGFVSQGPIPVPNRAPTVTAMWREPR